MPHATAATPNALAIAHDGWGELVLSRPHRRNAMIGPMITELRAGLARLLQGGAKAIVLRGAGGSFCSGLDLDAFSQTPPPDWKQSFAADYAALHRDLYHCPAILIGALERHAINGGASLALAPDLLVAGEGAFIQIGEAAIGMHAPMNVAWLRIKTSEAVAMQLALGARRTGAVDLHRLGLAYEVVADDQVTARACVLASTMAAYPGSGLASIKAALRRPWPGGDDIFDLVRDPATGTAPPTLARL